MGALWAVLGLLVGLLVVRFEWRRRVILRSLKTAAERHDEYERDRVDVRKRPGFHPDQRKEAVLQRAERGLHRHRVKVNRKKLERMLREIFK